MHCLQWPVEFTQEFLQLVLLELKQHFFVLSQSLFIAKILNYYFLPTGKP